MEQSHGNRKSLGKRKKNTETKKQAAQNIQIIINRMGTGKSSRRGEKQGCMA